MLLRISRFAIPIMLVALLAVTACGGSDESTGWRGRWICFAAVTNLLGMRRVCRQVCRGRQQPPQQQRLRHLGK